MKLLYVDTTAYAPISPWFNEALTACGVTWRLLDTSQWRPRTQPQWANVVLVVDGSARWLTSAWLQARRNEGARLVRFNPDDPWNAAVQCEPKENIPLYDLYISCKTAILDDLRQAGAQRVEYLACAWKPSIHFQERPRDAAEENTFATDVAIIGGADSSRVAIVKDLVQAYPDVSVALYGGYWDRESALRPYACGIVRGRDYRLAIGGATLCLNLLRRDNRDQHNMKSLEIPACGGIQACVRTDEMDALGVPYLAYDPHELLGALPQLLQAARRLRSTSPSPDLTEHTYIARLRQILAWVHALR